MIKWIFPKAIMIGILINVGAYLGVWFVFNFAMFGYNVILNRLHIADIGLIFEYFYKSTFINWAMIAICCALPMGGNYLSGRLSKGREWVNGSIVLLISMVATYLLGWDVAESQRLMVIILATGFAFLGSYFAYCRNKEEWKAEGIRRKSNV